MAEANAKHWFAFKPFDCPIYPLTVFVTHLSADVRCVDSWLFAGCELVPYPCTLPAHTAPLGLEFIARGQLFLLLSWQGHGQVPKESRQARVADLTPRRR